MLSWYPYAKLSQLDRISCETFRRPSLSPTPHPGCRACRTHRAERRHACPRLCRRLRPAGQDGPRWLARQQQSFQEGTPGERLSGWGYEYLQTLSYYTKAGNTNTLAAPSPSLWTCSRQAKSTSCPTSRIRQNASRSCSFPQIPRHRALLYLRQARPRRSGQG